MRAHRDAMIGYKIFRSRLLRAALTGVCSFAFSGTALSAAINSPSPTVGQIQTVQTGVPGSIAVGNASITYYAKSGDTLISIAQQYTEKSSNWIALGKLNKIDKDSSIPIGSPIVIPGDLLSDTPSKATVVAMTGNVSAQSEDGVATKLNIGATVTEGMQIETGGNSFLTFALPDQSRVSLPSNSRVRIAKLRKTRYTDSPRTEVLLQRGEVESRVAPLTAIRGRYEVRTPLSVAGVRGTHFRVGLIGEGSATRVATETLDGKVAVARASVSGPDGLVLTPGKGNITDKLVVGPAVDLLSAPALSSNINAAEFPSSRIALIGPVGAKAYHVQIATDADAYNLIAESRSSSANISVDGVADGAYFARLSAIDRFGLEGLIKVVPLTLRSSDATTANITLSPPYIAGSDEKSLTLRWSSSMDGAMRIQIARDGEFTYLIAARQSTNGQVTVTRPAFGNYYARVQLLDANGGVKASSFAQPFIVTDQWVMNDGNPVAVKQSRANADR
jgi:hypothetical protein